MVRALLDGSKTQTRMNRAMRRAAARAKPTEFEKVSVPKWLDEFEIFDPIDRMLQKLENGQIEFQQGAAVFMAGDGEWYEVVPALNGWISVWKRIDQHFQLGHDLSAMVRLCNCLNYGKPMTEHQVAAARRVYKEQLRLFRALPRDEIASVTLTEQIRMHQGK
jgi:hypothetical protein